MSLLCVPKISSIVVYIVGEDFTTLTGKEVITAVSDKEGKALVEILIHDDLLDENTECFTADLVGFYSESPDCINSSTVCILGTHTVLCTFQESEYFVYESAGFVTLKLNSSRPYPSDFNVDVAIIYGIGNASGKCQCQCIYTSMYGGQFKLQYC